MLGGLSSGDLMMTDAWRARLLRASLRLLLKPALSPRVPVAAQRRRVARLAALTRLAPGVARSDGALGGVPSATWRDASGAAPVRPGAILWLHGGAYTIGSPRTHAALASSLARQSGLPVHVPDYRLAPEHPFPAALDDALAAYAALAAEGPVLLGGDSAGGGLALAVALQARAAGLPAPAALLLHSPWGDLRPGVLPAPVPGEAMLDAAWLEACARAYAGDAAADPRVSPLLADGADLAGLPPVLVHAGADELLADQSRALATALRAAGVDATLEIVPGRWHAYALHAGLLPSADAAVLALARFGLRALDAALPPRHDEHAVVVLGAGMSGLCTAIGLQRAGRPDVVVLEQSEGLGGTWWDNRYPGAEVDVPAPAYAFSFAPNPHWTKRFADAPQIHAYQSALAARHALHARTRLGTRLVEARWDEADAHWHFRTARGDTLRARWFVCSTGPLSQPRWPDIPGLEDFRGLRLHTARWDASAPLDGQRVAVIGTGSTAVQLVPPIARRAARLHVFQRTANWVLPRLERRYRWFDGLLARVPPYAALVRAGWVAFLELTRRGFEDGTLMRRFMLWLAERHRRAQLPDPALREALTPDYPLGCKRIIYASDYYPTLAQPHVELVTAGIERITATGIRCTDGSERDVDALVCATGFDTVQLLQSIRVEGRGGRTLAEAWRDGPEALHGIGVAGFPNLFLMLGPNTATGHTSTLLFIEPAVQHAIACMRAVEAGGHRAIDVREDAQRAHNAALQQRLAGSVWAQCRSWYRLEGGRVVAIFPGFTREYVRALRVPDWSAYRFEPGVPPC
jgi:cation diffusion facilitator CzcD-associated flavoprotein CzcO/acetyl esterase/lipase